MQQPKKDKVEEKAPDDMPEKPSAALQAKRKQISLKFNLRATGNWIARLKDPEIGNVGKQFIMEINNLRCRERVHLPLRSIAVFNSFVLPPKAGQKSFTNGISYGAPALENKGRLFGARVHEFIHAMQYRKAVALHVDPFNAVAPCILNPLDYIKRKELLEQDAYAKGAWLQSLAKDIHPDIPAALDATPLSVSEFEKIRAGAPNLKEALALASLEASAKKGRWIKGDEEVPMRDLWHKLAIEEYARIVKYHKKKGATKFNFVRMHPPDIAEIGSSFGPNQFEKDNRFIAPPKLSKENMALLDKLHYELGLSIIAGYRGIDEGLAKADTNRADFMQHSRTHRRPKSG